MTHLTIRDLRPPRGWFWGSTWAGESVASLGQQIRNNAAVMARVLRRCMQRNVSLADTRDLDFRRDVLRHEARRQL